MTDLRHPDEDQLLDLAMGHAPTPERDRITAHLEVCAFCRRTYGEVADAIQLVLPAAPRIAPPPGFDAEVLELLTRGGALAARSAGTARLVEGNTASGRGRRVGVATPESASVPAPRRRSVRLAIAAALVGLGVGAGVTAGVLTADQQTPITAGADEATLVDSDGAAVGSVARGRGDDGPVLIIRIDDGPPGYEYTCRLILAGGGTRDVGQWQLDGEDPSRWVVPLPDGGVEAVEMV
ncbi:MAG TPA: hypothetical protein VK063_04905, partial [Beutenbergiaceae bacterium]|nr:hypothetical protein [Beutenbergiaceae bacterium]